MKINKVLLFVVLIGLIAASVILYGRLSVEKEAKLYEVSISIEEMNKIADLNDMTLAEILHDWDDVKIDSISVEEACLQNLKLDNKFKVKTEFRGYDVYIEASPEGIDFIKKGFDEVLKDRKVEKLSDTELLVEGKSSDFLKEKEEFYRSKLELVGLGFREDLLEIVKNSPYALRLRPRFENIQDSKASVDRFMYYVKRFSNQKYVVFASKNVLGNSENIEYVSNQFKLNNIAICLIENAVQRKHLEIAGSDELLLDMNYDAIRVFTTWEFIQKRFDYELAGHHNGEEIINTYFRAISDRNIRIIFFKAFIDKNKDVIYDKEIYIQRLDDLNKKLATFPNNISNVNKSESEIKAMKNLSLRPLWLMFVSFAVVAAFLMALENLFTIKNKILYILLIIGIIPCFLIYFLKIKIGLFNSVFGLASNLSFSVLSIEFALLMAKKYKEEPIKKTNLSHYIVAAAVLFSSVAISLIGAIMESSFYSESKYLLELAVFRGVKLSLFLPIVFALFYAVIVFADRVIVDGKEQNSIYLSIRNFMNSNLKMWHAVLGGIIVLGLLILIARSGHETNMKPSSIELLMRHFFENYLPARPRTKALLFGYPGLFLLIFYARNHKYELSYLLLSVFVALGQANVLNTFSHIRTPFMVSLTRVGTEFVVSIILSLIYIVVIKIISRCANKLIKRKYV